MPGKRIYTEKRGFLTTALSSFGLRPFTSELLHSLDSQLLAVFKWNAQFYSWSKLHHRFLSKTPLLPSNLFQLPPFF